ncbi:syntaxin-18 isoform X3 [Sphaerodactylus townsendi]|uniref:syntaxin-18 isoform X3 n=1 Tax=Sphaerodactylus townsendi TaxID=933632 RepID=UPI002025CE47|nr:syntaxin-18 isoform X3 [Sphaerodactylus townsendi]
MAADITLLFKASVKTVKTRNKALGVSLGGGGGGGGGGGDDPLLLLKRAGNARPKGDFSGRARDVVNNIGKLKDFLLQHRKDYINAYSHVMSEYVRMTDTERDQIDQDAQIFMRACADAIQQLRTEGVCKLYSEQRAIRSSLCCLIRKRLSRLEPEQSNKAKGTCSPERTVQVASEEQEDRLLCEENKDKNVIEDHSIFGTWADGKGEDELSPEEIQMFEQENQRLVGEMNSLFDEVRQIEGKVVEISRLQEIFTENVLKQEAEIDNIHQLVVGATENIKEGNEDIREAIKNNAGFRVWILFFLVMCSFSLLFLDWYGS